VGGGVFSSGVSFGCANLPALTSCGFSPASIAAGAGTTTVILTIATMGPNSGTQSRPRAGAVLRTAWTLRLGSGQARGDARPHTSTRPYVLPFFTLAWVVVVGIVGIGKKRRGKPRLCGGVAWICLGLGLMALISCGGVAGGGGGPPPPVTVTVSPGSANLFADEAGNSWPAGVTQKQFTAIVNNSSNQSVTWAVAGGSANGTVDGTGLYTTPAVVSNPAAVTVTATAAADATKSGSAKVNVETPTGLGTSQITVTATAAGGAAHGDVVTLIVQ
jgi:hypothetical protein